MVLPNIHLIIITAFISFSANWQFAYQITYVNPAYDIIREEAGYGTNDSLLSYNYSNHNEEWSKWWGLIVSSFYPGSLIGFILVPYLISKFGTRLSFFYTTIFALFGCLLQMVPKFINLYQFSDRRNLPIFLIIGRFVIGLQSGCSLSLLPLFINEISFKSETTFLATFQQISQALSTMIGLILGSNQIIPTKNEYKFFTCQVAAIIPTILFFVFIALAPNTPSFIMKKSNNFKSLEKSLVFYRGSTYHISEQRCLITEIKNKENKKDNFLRDSNKLNIIKSFFIGCLASISYTFTGDDIVDSYSSTIMMTAFPNLEKFWIDMTAVFFSFILFLSSIFGSLIIHKIGTRRALIFGLIGTAISNFFAFFGNLTETFTVTTLSFCVSKIFIGIGAGGPAWFLMSKLVPPEIRNFSQSFSTGCLLLTTGICTYLYPVLNTYYSYYTFIILSTIPALIISLILFLFLPEVESKSYEELKIILENNFFSGISCSVKENNLQCL